MRPSYATKVALAEMAGARDLDAWREICAKNALFR